MTQQASWVLEEFAKEWVAAMEEVVNQLLANPDIEQIKQRVRAQGHVELDDREQFIELVNKIKYDVIFAKFGPEDSEGYAEFSKAWQHWHKLRATAMPKPQNMFEDNIHHLLFGSTPDPDAFLKDFNINSDL